jgi:hypothetical protein
MQADARTDKHKQSEALTKRSSSLTIRMAPALRERIDRLAAADRRSVSSLVEILLEEACARREG